MDIQNAQLKAYALQYGGRVQRVQGSTAQSGLDALDLAFLDLLGSVQEAGLPQPGATSRTAEPPAAEKPAANAQRETTPAPVVQPAVTDADNPGPVQRRTGADDQDLSPQDLTLLMHQLGPDDLSYLKQVVIPALPIVMGSVPLDTVFKTTGSGQLDFGGYTLSDNMTRLIEKGYKTGQAIRIDMDKDSSLILRIVNGQVSASFVSADRAGAFYIKQQLDDLRQRMIARNLPVGTLEYQDQSPEQDGHPRRQQSSPWDLE
ncbi:MAG: hypothetical protein AB7P76_00130 [Candidatus Melainabacteria bacterium]